MTANSARRIAHTSARRMGHSFGASLTVAPSYICSNKSTSGILNILITCHSAAWDMASGRMAQTPRAGTGDSVGRFRRYRWSTLINYNSNLSMCGTFLQKSIHLPDYCGLLATPKEIHDLNLSAVTLSIWLFRFPTLIFGTQELYNPCFFGSASIPSPGLAREEILKP